MASIINNNQASNFIRSNKSSTSSFPSSSSSRYITSIASIHLPKITTNNTNNNNKLGVFAQKNNTSTTLVQKLDIFPRVQCQDDHHKVMEKLYAILEAVSNRVEMHNNIKEQRNNWNTLMLTSINTITLSAATMCGIASTISTHPGAPFQVLNLTSTFMYLAATGMLFIMNNIQPSQLVEEQRNAARLFKELESEIKTKIAIESPTLGDVNEAMKKVLAIDRAYPLPLLGAMLEKFPTKVEPAVWWPQKEAKKSVNELNDHKNGWSVELEEEMREIVKVLEIKDKADYLRLGEKALKLNKALAVAGPVLTGSGAIGSLFLASSPHSSWAMVLGVMGGAMASVVNTIQHGGQVGMVFEMFRSNAGFFKMMQESIESNLKEKDLESRENGEVFEMKVALQLGRSLSELRDIDIEEFGSKLFY